MSYSNHTTASSIIFLEIRVIIEFQKHACPKHSLSVENKNQITLNSEEISLKTFMSYVTNHLI